MSKCKLFRVWIDIDGVADVSGFHGGLEIIGAVKAKTNDECLSGKSER